jgi:hypothetical protein
MKDNQHEQLFTELTAEFEAPAFTELDNEIAATCSGGYAILYENANFGGRRLRIESGVSNLGNYSFNDITSSIQIREGETWAFYRDTNYRNLLFTGRDGNYSTIPGNDQISSARRIA